MMLNFDFDHFDENSQDYKVPLILILILLSITR